MLVGKYVLHTQILFRHLGFQVLRKQKPTQGVQLKCTVFGKDEALGFYNAFAVQHNATLEQELGLKDISVFEGPAEVALPGGEVIAVRGGHFVSVQFHPESILSTNGFDIVRDAVTGLLGLQVVEPLSKRARIE